MLGVLVNVATVLVGSLLGLLFKKGIPEKVSSVVMSGVGLCVLYIGISGALEGQNTLILVGSVALGALIGSLCHIDDGLNKLGDMVSARGKQKSGKLANLGEGFVSGTLLFCVGAMTVVGSLEAGVSGDNTTLYVKSLLDLVSSMILSVTLGIGVIFAAVSVFVLQGGLVLLSGVLQPLLTDAAITAMTCAGSVLIMGLGLNMLGVTKIKVADLLPAIVIAPILTLLIK